jgi:endoglucanase
MKAKLFHTVFLALAAMTILASCQSIAPKPAKEAEAITFVKGLGLGYNLGNTLDACGGTMGNKIANFEVAWGAPVTTKAIFVDLKNRGFDSIRIPVAWSNLMADDYAIHPDLMNRVEEITRMVLDSGMYAIINIHWDGGWIGNFPAEPAESMKKYKAIWTQISARFKDYDERLIFESMNEEGCFNDVWNRYTDGDASPKKQKAFDILNGVNQAFVDLVRSAGGKNGSRYLLIAGYATDIDLTCSKEFRMPADKAKRSIVSVHYYTPSTFTILEKDADWGKSARSWGSPREIAQLKADMLKVKTAFIDKGSPAILGEYGTVINNKDPESVRLYLTEVARAAWGVGMCPMLWGAADQHYDRKALKFTDEALGNMYLGLSRTPRDTYAIDPADAVVSAEPAKPAVAAEPAAVAVIAAEPVAEEKVLDEAVGPSSGNKLAESLGTATVVVDKDTSFTSSDAVKGASVQMVEYLGKKALKVTKNGRNEIRIAFVLDKPAKAAGYTSLQFSVAGFDGWEGSYNCGLLYADGAKPSGERAGSFYVGRVQKTAWTAVAANLSFDEQWGKNFSPDKDIYSIQFWSNSTKVLYISDVTLK